ncbi:MAG: amidohydrolase [Oscillospiraceae bacterium]|nr:amidohydrolase [Oscillospiraceae bacterium]
MTQLEFISRIIDDNAGATKELARVVWGYAELAYQEMRSAGALSQALEDAGFTVEMGIAGIPTAFTATFRSGTGKPVAAILGEYDALDALSQQAALPEKAPVCEGEPGHGCGHNLLGVGGLAAAVAVKEYLAAENRDGTIIYFGCPAEEGAGSKQFIARAGYFDDVDFAYTWHPATENTVSGTGDVAIMGANFIFDGVASHAGGAPHLGRSALDAAELMNVGVNYLREHMIDEARVHYAYSDAGGTAPNVVPAHAVIKYEVRAPKVAQVQELFSRVVNIAKGAALMTETKMEYEITMAFSDYVPNKTLAQVVSDCLAEVGPPAWDEEDYALAYRFLHTYNKSTMKTIREEAAELYGEENVDEVLARPLDSVIHPFDPKERRYHSGSTDVGDVGYATPTVNLNVATACVGNVGHSWQNTAFSNSPIGDKGMLTAAKVLALATVRTMEDPALIERARAELLHKNGGKYVCPLPDYVDPPIGRY